MRRRRAYRAKGVKKVACWEVGRGKPGGVTRIVHPRKP